MIGVKYFKQLKPGMCGAAALQMIYDYYGNSIDQNNIWNSIKVPRRSGGEYTTSAKLALHAINLGYPTILVRGDLTTLQTLLLQDIPPIVCQQLSENNPLKGHFRVILGINSYRQHCDWD
ncbi:MAG: papain-like cysteine protease family protein [Candidatus Hydrothermarchaeota archaeon]|nr:papain-like cysteine protease family protein [Candidatus Hydrothermarchaeota archaeon]